MAPFLLPSHPQSILCPAAFSYLSGFSVGDADHSSGRSRRRAPSASVSLRSDVPLRFSRRLCCCLHCLQSHHFILCRLSDTHRLFRLCPPLLFHAQPSLLSLRKLWCQAPPQGPLSALRSHQQIDVQREVIIEIFL